MLSDQELKALNKIANSSLLKNVYPMVDRVEITYVGEGRKGHRKLDNYKVAVYLNDDSITEKNMYEKEFDPHYLISRYIGIDFLYYLGIPRYNNQFWIEAYSPDGSVILTDY